VGERVATEAIAGSTKAAKNFLPTRGAGWAARRTSAVAAGAGRSKVTRVVEETGGGRQLGMPQEPG